MIPLGHKKVVINRDNGQTVERPCIWAISIRKSSNPQLLAQVIPALNASVKLQIEVPYRAVAAPTAHKTDEEITVMITKGIHRQLWNHRRPRTELKKDRVQAWVDDFPTIICDYGDRDRFEEPELARDLAYALAEKLQKVRADKRTGQVPETLKEHEDRVVEQVAKWSKLLKIPLDVTADIPQFAAVRYGYDKPLSGLDDYQFMAKTPKHMKWLREESVDNPPSFLDFKVRALPKHDDMDTLVTHEDQEDGRQVSRAHADLPGVR